MTDKRDDDFPQSADPGYLWRMFMGYIEPSRRVCPNCGRDQVHSSDAWQHMDGKIECAAADSSN